MAVRRNRTLLDALRDAGVDMMWDCLRGECGLCAVEACWTPRASWTTATCSSARRSRATAATIITCVSRAVGGAITIDTGFRPDPDHGAATQRIETR